MLQAILDDPRITQNWTVAVTLPPMRLSPQSLGILQISTNQPRGAQSDMAIATAIESLKNNLPRSVHKYFYPSVVLSSMAESYDHEKTHKSSVKIIWIVSLDGHCRCQSCSIFIFASIHIMVQLHF